MKLNLTQNEKKALEEFKTNLKQNFSDLIQDVVVFGSKARGDFNQFSDIDVLVVVQKRDQVLYRHISDLAYESGYHWDSYLSVKLISEEDRKQSDKIGQTFLKNIEEDGISLWKAA